MGQELKLVKTGATGSPIRARENTARAGTVFGRLLNKRRPLANCRVTLVPLQKSYGGYTANGAVQPFTATTDGQGRYHFAGVPVGPYKLFWQPQGQGHWIRRIEFRPDVVVRNKQTSQIKDIRVALRTVN